MLKRLLKYNNKLQLTEGNVIKNVWALAFPLMVCNILQTAFNLVDLFWVSRLGLEAMAAVAMSGVILMVVITVIFGIATGTLAMVSRFIGAGNQTAADNAAMQALIVGGVMGLILALAGLAYSGQILQFLGAQGATLRMGTDYLRIVLVGGLVMIYLSVVNAIFRAAGDTFTPIALMVGSAILNIVLDPLMIFGIGFPRMEVRGAALATVLSRGLAALLGIYILFKGYSRVRVRLEKLRADIKTILRIVAIGFPNSIQLALRSIVGVVLMYIMARYGEYAVAAYGIGLRIFSVVLMPAFAFAVSAATLVGQNLGANKFIRAKTCAWSAAGFNILLMSAAAILFFIFSANLISIFTNNSAIINIGRGYLQTTSFGYVFVALSLVFGYSLMGAGDTVPPMLIAAFSLLAVQIPLAFILPGHLRLGITGVWAAIVISAILQGTLTTFWFNLGRWRFKRI